MIVRDAGVTLARMDNLEARLAALELAVERMGMLERTIAELRLQLDREQTRVRTMRQTFQCPSCHGRRVLHFRRINEAGKQELLPLSLSTGYSFWWGAREGDPLEVYVCRACGLLEWHAPHIDKLEPDGKNIIELVGPEERREDEPDR